MPHYDRNSSGLAAVMLAFVVTTSCSHFKGPEPAPYVAPEIGTVYHYEGTTNTITAVDGLRTHFVDGQGRQGSRLALFIADDPREPAEVAADQLSAIWPLEVGKESVITVNRGPEIWEWEVRVSKIETITVPAGTFETYVVQAVEAPQLVRSPDQTSTASYTWWYAPEVEAVVRFRTTYLGGPATGRVIESGLVRIERPDRPADE
jgi:hypothetical protein